MANNHAGNVVPVMNEASTAEAGIQGDGATFTKSDKSGIAVTASGKVVANSSIPATGYYEEGDTSLNKTYTAEETQYIDTITIAEGKALDKITNAGEIEELANGGKIDKLSGTGEIGELDGKQTIDTLNGEVVILDAPTGATSSAKVVFEGTTLVDEGKIVESTTVIENGKVIVTPGWVFDSSEGGEIDIEEGAYEVQKELKAAPTVTISTTPSNVATSETETAFAITVGHSKTAGNVAVAAEITKAGYINAGSDKSAIDVEATVEGDKTVYLQAAQFEANVVASDEVQANGVVPATYDFVCKQEGYVKEGVKASIDAYDGAFSWAE